MNPLAPGVSISIRVSKLSSGTHHREQQFASGAVIKIATGDVVARKGAVIQRFTDVKHRHDVIDGSSFHRRSQDQSSED